MMLFSLFSLLVRSETQELPYLYIEDSNMSILQEKPLLFLMVNLKGNNFCDDVIDDFKDAAKEMQGKIECAIIEANTSEVIRQTYHFYSYPSYFVFRNGKVTTEYNNMRDKNSILKYLKRISGPNYIKLEDGRDVRDFLDSEKVSVVLAAEDIDPELLETFDEVASQMKDLLAFATVTDPDAIDLLNLDSTPALQLNRISDRGVVNFPLSSSFTTETIEDFLRDNIRPHYRMYDSTVFRDISQDRRYTIISFVDTTKKKSFDMMHKIMTDVYDEFGENFTYVYCDIYDMGSTMVLPLGFQGLHDPCFAILQVHNQQVLEKHILPDKYDATPRRVLSFVRKFYNQTVTKNRVISEPVPEVNPGPFKKLVASEFSSVVMNQTNDVVVVFNNRTDKEEQEIMDVMNTVAHEFARQKVATVSFYHFNLTANTTPGFSLPDTNSSCSIVIFPAEGKTKPALLPTEADAKTLCTFIQKSSKSKYRFRVPRRLSVSSFDFDL